MLELAVDGLESCIALNIIPSPTNARRKWFLLHKAITASNLCAQSNSHRKELSIDSSYMFRLVICSVLGYGVFDGLVDWYYYATKVTLSVVFW